MARGRGRLEPAVTAIAIPYPPEIDAIREGLDRFLQQEVIPRHERHAALLDD